MVVGSVDKKSKPGENQVRLCNYTDVYYNSEMNSTLDLMVATANEGPRRRQSLCMTKPV